MKQCPRGGSQWGNLPEERSREAEGSDFRLQVSTASLRHMLAEGLVQDLGERLRCLAGAV